MVATKIEGLAVASLVWSLLSADTGAGGVSTLLGGRIYRDRVPQSAALPALTVTLVTDVDTATLGGVRVFTRSEIDVHLIGQGIDYGALNAAAKRADTVVQQGTGNDGGVHVVELVRERTTAYIEDAAGAAYTHVVMTYATPAYAT